MKKVLAWVKANLMVVIFSAIIVIVLPVSYVVSAKWNKSIREKRQKEVEADYNRVVQMRVTYGLPAMPGEPSTDITVPPNEVLTKFFADHKRVIEAQAGGVVKAAEDFNTRNHRDQDGKPRVLVEGLLPASSGPDFQSKARRMAERLVGNDSQPSAYTALFDSIRAGPPISGPDMAQRLAEQQQREIDQIVGAQGGRSLTPEEQAKVTKAVLEKRKALTQQHAGKYSVYGSTGALAGFVPATAPNEPPPITRCFQWQADYWLVEDLLAAVKAANTGADGQTTAISESVVKRIERIMPKPSLLGVSVGESAGQTGYSGEGEAPAAPAPPSPTAQVAPDFNKSITGRWSGEGNGVYDVRRVEMVLVVSSRNLPKFIDAVSRTNFMTVTDCDLFEVDLWADLEQGFYYGEESVVRARVEIETIWLRSWTTPLMPKDLRTALGIPEPEAPAEAEKKDGPG